MAVVLKRATSRSKGVVVFTHKERMWLDLDAPVIGAELRALRQRYFVLMHWGWIVEGEPARPVVDLHIARESTLRFRSGVEARRVALNSAMFTSRDFRPRGLEKQWDVISITRTLKNKRTDQLLDCLRLVYDRRPSTTALVICVGLPETGHPHHQDDLWERYMTRFTPDERERFTFVLLRVPYLHPFSRRDIAFFYNSSRVFTLFSDREGASKVIKEALLCGIPVVVKEQLEGGGLDFLHQGNSRLFRDAQDGAAKLIDLLEHPERIAVDPSVIADEIGEAANIPRFRRAVEGLFEAEGTPFEGELDTENLSRTLPSHVRRLPDALRSPLTDDLRSGRAFVQFLRMLQRDLPLERVRVSAAERALLAAFDRVARLRLRAAPVLRRLGAAV